MNNKNVKILKEICYGNRDKCFWCFKRIKQRFCRCIKKINEIGFTYFEPLIEFDSSFNKLKQRGRYLNLKLWKFNKGIRQSSLNAVHYLNIVRENNFVVNSIQINSDILKLNKYQEEVISFLNDNNITYAIISPRLDNINEIERIIPELIQFSEKLDKYHKKLLIHNHDIECKTINNDKSEIILDYYLKKIPLLNVELDIGWSSLISNDLTSKILIKYSSRINIIHFKDLVLNKDNKIIFTAIGEGKIDLKDVRLLINELPNLDKYGLIIDQDKSNNDLFKELDTGFKNIKKFLKI